MQQKREPQNNPPHIWSVNLWQRNKKHTVKKGQSFQQMVLGKQDSHMQMNKNEPLFYAIDKN